MNNNKVQRYEWEDSILKAERLGLLPPPSVNMALRLAHAINWVPKDKNKPAGLYWDNESALKQVGSSRSTYFRVKGPLFEHGFFIQVKGNLIPQVPDLSHFETEESHIETDQSQVETQESQSDTPFTVNTFSDNTLSVNSLSDNARVGDASHLGAGSSVDLVKNKSDKDNEEEPALRAAPDSLIVLNELESPISSNESSGLILNNEEVADSPIALNEEGAGGAVAAGAVKTEKVTDKWKKANGVNVIETEQAEWMKPDWKPAPKKEVPSCPKCGEADFTTFCWECGHRG